MTQERSRTTGSLRTLAAATAVSIALAASTASAQTVEPVRVGIIDTPVTKIIGGDHGVKISSASFLDAGQRPGSARTEVNLEHGSVVASSFVEQSRRIDPSRPIEIYSAQAFSSADGDRDSLGNKPLSLRYAAATRALDWFKANDVRVVVAAFNSPDGPGVQKFMGRAKELGIVVFAGTNNVQTRTPPFPARHPDAISVTGKNADLDFRFNRSMDSWVMFQADGNIPGSKGGKQLVLENGSSYAVARAAAFGSHAVAAEPGATKDRIVERMRAATGTDEIVRDLSQPRVAVRFRTGAPVTSVARAPVREGDEQVLAALASKGSQQR